MGAQKSHIKDGKIFFNQFLSGFGWVGSAEDFTLS